jgi:hypothetical protein
VSGPRCSADRIAIRITLRLLGCPDLELDR